LGLSSKPVVTVESSWGRVSIEGEAFLDEELEGLAAAAALSIAERKVSAPPRLIIVDAWGEVFFEVGEQGGESSTKVGLSDRSGFIRVVLSRAEKRVVGLRGRIERRALPQVLDAALVLMLRGELCDNLPYLAAARSMLFAECYVSRALLGLAARLCL